MLKPKISTNTNRMTIIKALRSSLFVVVGVGLIVLGAFGSGCVRLFLRRGYGVGRLRG